MLITKNNNKCVLFVTIMVALSGTSTAASDIQSEEESQTYRLVIGHKGYSRLMTSPPPLSDLTLTAWVNVSSFPRGVAPILTTVAHDASSQLAFFLRHDGVGVLWGRPPTANAKGQIDRHPRMHWDLEDQVRHKREAVDYSGGLGDIENIMESSRKSRSFKIHNPLSFVDVNKLGVADLQMSGTNREQKAMGKTYEDWTNVPYELNMQEARPLTDQRMAQPEPRIITEPSGENDFVFFNWDRPPAPPAGSTTPKPVPTIWAPAWPPFAEEERQKHIEERLKVIDQQHGSDNHSGSWSAQVQEVQINPALIQPTVQPSVTSTASPKRKQFRFTSASRLRKTTTTPSPVQSLAKDSQFTTIKSKNKEPEVRFTTSKFTAAPTDAPRQRTRMPLWKLIKTEGPNANEPTKPTPPAKTTLKESLTTQTPESSTIGTTVGIDSSPIPTSTEGIREMDLGQVQKLNPTELSPIPIADMKIQKINKNQKPADVQHYHVNEFQEVLKNPEPVLEGDTAVVYSIPIANEAAFNAMYQSYQMQSYTAKPKHPHQIHATQSKEDETNFNRLSEGNSQGKHQTLNTRKPITQPDPNQQWYDPKLDVQAGDGDNKLPFMSVTKDPTSNHWAVTIKEENQSPVVIDIDGNNFSEPKPSDVIIQTPHQHNDEEIPFDELYQPNGDLEQQDEMQPAAHYQDSVHLSHEQLPPHRYAAPVRRQPSSNLLPPGLNIPRQRAPRPTPVQNPEFMEDQVSHVLPHEIHTTVNQQRVDQHPNLPVDIVPPQAPRPSLRGKPRPLRPTAESSQNRRVSNPHRNSNNRQQTAQMQDRNFNVDSTQTKNILPPNIAQKDKDQFDPLFKKLPYNFLPQQWYHLTFTWSAVDHKVDIYVNGEYTGTLTDVLPRARRAPGGGPTLLGQTLLPDLSQFDPTSQFTGQMSDVNLWTSRLNPDSIKSLFLCGQKPPVSQALTWQQITMRFYNDIRIEKSQNICGRAH